jgi:anti-anti-sigma factor
LSDSLDLPGSIESPIGSLPDLVCTCRVSGRDSVWVHVTGKLDRGSASLLEQTLGRFDHRLGMVVLDLRRLTLIDLAGVRVIVDASIEAWLGDRRLLLVRGPSHVDRVFALADVSDVVEIGDLHPPADSVNAPPAGVY